MEASNWDLVHVLLITLSNLPRKRSLVYGRFCVRPSESFLDVHLLIAAWKKYLTWSCVRTDELWSKVKAFGSRTTPRQNMIPCRKYIDENYMCKFTRHYLLLTNNIKTNALNSLYILCKFTLNENLFCRFSYYRSHLNGIKIHVF